MDNEPTNCESCGMPLDETSTSKYDKKYCIYCQSQETGELASYEQVREGSINAAVQHMNKTEAEATTMADEMLPTLPRWKKKEETEESI